MKQYEVFGDAKWVCAGNYTKKDAYNVWLDTLDVNGVPHFPILRGTFPLCGVCSLKKATLRVLGLGFFHCYINGTEVTKDQFLPLSTDYEARTNDPIEESLTGHRIYVPEYDVTQLLQEGSNVIAVHFGGGWYTYEGGKYGDPKAIYRLIMETECGTTEVVSNEFCKIGDSFVKTYHLTEMEHQDFTDDSEAAYGNAFDDSAWRSAQLAKPLDTEYLFSDCPVDRVIKEYTPVFLKEDENGKHYDAGCNMSSYPVLKVTAKKGETVTVLFSEECMEDGTPDPRYGFRQRFIVTTDGTERIVWPRFLWYAYRYFTVRGDAEPLTIKRVHTNVAVNSSFASDHETLNWIYNAFINTQLSNMHAGIPSDCPHAERRGYTGDGQLICHAAMTTLDAQKFYQKWIQDISDCQDIYTGHVQYTAPYLRSGGGPGGWGCAIVEVPYQYYKHYGDITPAKQLYPQMLRYFDYLESHSRNLLVESDKQGEWCLGDWCAPIQVALPAPFVNNYFYVKAMQQVIEIGRLIGRETEIPMLEQRIRERKEAMTTAYFNTWDGNFIGGFQGANAFAIDIGIGDERTYRNLVTYYQKLGRYDTGIFGTDIVTRVLFAHGDGALAAQLLMSKDPISYDGMRAAGATTLWEYWPLANHDRSHNHPMFGAVTAYLFEYLLGIRAKAGVPAYREMVIAPILVDGVNHMSGTKTVPAGKIFVSYTKDEEKGSVTFTVTIPKNLTAVFQYQGRETVLSIGENRITEPLSV